MALNEAKVLRLNNDRRSFVISSPLASDIDRVYVKRSLRVIKSHLYSFQSIGSVRHGLLELEF